MAVDNTRRDDDIKKLFLLVKDLENKSIILEENQFRERADTE
jgi:predicted  nucleic acid-binding Zn-ribbon protein